MSELPPGVFVLGEREVMIRNTQGQLRSVPYESWGDLTFNREKIGKWVKVVTLVGVPLVFLLMAFFFFAWRVLLSAMLAGVFVRYARRIPQPFRFADRVRLCAVALTPAVLIGTAVEWLPARLAYFWVIRAIVVGTYAFYALRANVQPPEVAVAAIQGSSPATPPS